MKKRTILTLIPAPKKYRDQYTGVCLTEEGELYFGWRGPHNSNLCFCLGNAMQKAIILMNRHGYEEVILDIAAEFTEYKQPQKISITPCK